MKIGLLTYYEGLNCGTNMQAYSTLLALREAYPNDTVDIIPFQGFKMRLTPYKTFSPIHLFNDIKRIAKYIRFKKDQLGILHDMVIEDVDKALNYISSFNYDLIYVGADTLLELDRLPKSYDGLSAYWLKDIKAKKVLIAASSKNVEYDALTPKQKSDIAIAAKQFAHIGVRDRATVSLFKKILDPGTEIDYIPDPTFCYDIDYSYIENYLKSKKIKIPEKSVYVQFYGDDVWLTEAIKEVKEAGYTIITNRGVSWSDIVLIDMSPLEQVGLYKYLSFVITHRFHDGVFCMKNHTPVLIYVKSSSVMMTASGESKHVSLLKDFGIYPQAFLGAVDSTQGLKGLLQSYKDVCSVYDESFVEMKLKSNKETYLKFLEASKR